MSNMRVVMLAYEASGSDYRPRYADANHARLFTHGNLDLPRALVASSLPTPRVASTIRLSSVCDVDVVVHAPTIITDMVLAGILMRMRDGDWEDVTSSPSVPNAAGWLMLDPVPMLMTRVGADATRLHSNLKAWFNHVYSGNLDAFLKSWLGLTRRKRVTGASLSRSVQVKAHEASCAASWAWMALGTMNPEAKRGFLRSLPIDDAYKPSKRDPS